MRIEKSITSVTWIPSEAIKGMTKMPFEVGVTHYDDPPPDVIEDLDGLIESGAIRFANVLRAWIEVEDGRIIDHGYSGGGRVGVTNFSVGNRHMLFPAISFPDMQSEPEVHGSRARFVQTAGGRTPLPAPRHVNRPPFMQIVSPIAWTTLSLTIDADGSVLQELSGASTFPRHWIYDAAGKLAAKSGVIDFKKWYRNAFGEHTPWGDEDSPAIVTEVESALERELSRTLMGGRKPKIKRFTNGKKLVEQGRPGTDMFLLLDGVLRVEVDGESLAELGPGAIVGERAALEGGTRTSTLIAVTPCKVAIVSAEEVDREALAELAEGHKREDQGS
jgi:Cyclic nucleotide-binding domain